MYVLPVPKIFGQEGLIAMDIFRCCYTVFYHCTLPTAFFLTNENARKYLHLVLNTN
ncbi:hypothetical protein WUBG_12178, partial [Wuchereria bancrofti]